jgi:hypothetical protein
MKWGLWVLTVAAALVAGLVVGATFFNPDSESSSQGSDRCVQAQLAFNNALSARPIDVKVLSRVVINDPQCWSADLVAEGQQCLANSKSSEEARATEPCQTLLARG